MIFAVVLSFLVLVSLVGNTLVILTVLINKPMQTTLNYLLVNLAVADMIFALSISIQYVITPFLSHPEGETGRYRCTYAFVTNGTIAWVGGAVSILCLVYIAVERYFAIIHPLRQRGRFTRRRLKVFIVLGWPFAILINMPNFMSTRDYQPGVRLCRGATNLESTNITGKVNGLVWMVLAGIVPVCIMVYLYSRVVHHLWFKPVENLVASQRAALRYRKHVTITLIAVTIIYAVSWIPNLTAYLMEYWGEMIKWFDQTGTALLAFNSCVNPVLYSMRMKSFREHLRDMLLCRKSQAARGQAAVVRVGPTTGQPINGSEESARNTAAPTPFSFSSAFREEMITGRALLNVAKSRRKSSIICGTTANAGKIETTLWARISESKKATGNVGGSSRNLQESMKTEQSSDALAAIGTNGSAETGENAETWL